MTEQPVHGIEQVAREQASKEVGGRREQEEEVGIEDVFSYLDGKIKKWEALRDRYPRNSAVPLHLTADVKKAPVQIKRLEVMREAIGRGEYRGIYAELGKDLQVQQDGLELLRKKLETGGFADDERYYAAKENAKKALDIAGKLEESDKEWFNDFVVERIRDEMASTGRGSVLSQMEDAKRRIDHLSGLQNVVVPARVPEQMLPSS